MDKKTLKIVSKLRQNARNTLKDISRMTKIPISTIFDKLKVYEGTIIERYVSLLNFENLGYASRANILIKENKEDKEEFRNFIKNHQNINSACKINNEYDYLIEVVFKQIKEMDCFLEMIQKKFNILDYKIFYVVNDIKREEFFSDDNLLEISNLSI